MSAPAQHELSRTNALYPLGYFGLLFVNTLFNQWVVYFHAPPGSAAEDARLVGLLLLLGYVLQGVLNPLVGLWSDRVRTRWGRRRPFLLFGAVPLLVVFALQWLDGAPPALIFLYCVLYVLVVQPYLSLLPTLAPDAKTRQRFTLLGAAFALTAGGSALLVGPLLIEAFGFVGLSVAGGGVFFVTVVLVAVVLREPASAAAKHAHDIPHEPASVLHRAGLVRFLIGTGLLTSAVMTLLIAAPFFVEGVLQRPRQDTAVLNGWLFGGMVASVGLLAVLMRHASSLRLMKVGAAIGASVLVTGAAVTLRHDSEAAFVVWLGVFFALGFVALANLALPSLVVAEVAAADPNGREGLLFGLNGMAVGFGNALGGLLSSSLLALGSSGADPRGIYAVVAYAVVALLLSLAALPATIR